MIGRISSRSRPGQRGKITAETEKIRAKQKQALELRSAGATYDEIAEALGYASNSGAVKAVKKALERQQFEAAKDVILLDIGRLDEYQKRLTQKLRSNGDLSTIPALLNIMDKRYKLLGIADSDVAELREQHGVSRTVTNNGVMVVQVGHNSEQDFIRKMMIAANVNPNSPEATQYLENMGEGGGGVYDAPRTVKALPPAPKKKTSTTENEKSAGHDVSRSRTVAGRGEGVEVNSSTSTAPGGKKKITVKRKVKVVRSTVADHVRNVGAEQSEAPEKSGGRGEGVGVPPIEGRTVNPVLRTLHTANPTFAPDHRTLDEHEVIDAEIIG